jgi:hypothetical protein
MPMDAAKINQNLIATTATSIKNKYTNHLIPKKLYNNAPIVANI